MEKTNLETKTYFEALHLFISSPKTAFQIVIDKSEKAPQLILLGLYGLLNVISPILIYEKIAGEIIFKLIFKGLMGAAMGWVGIWFLSQLTNVLNNILKGDSESDDVFTAFSFALLPVIMSLIIITIIGMVINPTEIFQMFSGILILIAFIWTCILLFIGNRVASKLNWFKNFVSVSIPLIIIIIVNIVMMRLRT